MTKLNKKFPQLQIDPKYLVSILMSIPKDQLAKKGLWIHSFGNNYMPIIVCNPTHRRVWE